MRLLPILLLLSGCASIFGPDDWEPSGHMYVASSSPLGAVHLYRPNPAEKPTIERVEVAEGKFIDVKVWANKCVGNDIESAYALDDIYLCGLPHKKPHEIAHKKGMQHTPWVSTGLGTCATVVVAGYKTDYKVGQEICNINNLEVVSK